MSPDADTTETVDETEDVEQVPVSECECQACSDPSIPHQPLNVSESRTTHSHESKGRREGAKTYSRKIQQSWYKQYPWITVCSSKYRIFCASCLSTRKQGLLTFSKRQNNTFLDTGFKSWNKALERLNEHEKSQMHKEVTLKLAMKHSSTDIGHSFVLSAKDGDTSTGKC